MFVTVIIPVKDQRPLLVQAVRSALDQGGLVAEVIVVDDRSSDGSGDAALGMDPRVDVLRGEGVGPAAARNIGAKAARTEVLAFLDSDDVWEPGGLAPRFELLVRNVDCAMVFSDALLTDRLDRPLARLHQHRAIASGRIYPRLLLDNFIATSSVLVRAEAFNATVGFQADFQPAEDYRLWLRLASGWPCVVDPEARVRRRLRPAGFGADRLASISAQAAVLEDSLAADGRPELAQWPPLMQRLMVLHHVRAQLLAGAGRRDEALDAYDASKKWDRVGFRRAMHARLTKSAFPIAKRIISQKRLGLQRFG